MNARMETLAATFMPTSRQPDRPNAGAALAAIGSRVAALVSVQGSPSTTSAA
jgi:hypothetical protein